MSKKSVVSADGSVKVVLFDLGGVLLKLHDPQTTFGLPIEDYDFHARWIASPTVRAYERGELAASVFGESMAVELELNIDGTEFMRRFDRWLDGVFPGVDELIDRIPRQYKKAVLSNINDLHWQYVAENASFLKRIDQLFLSFELGMTKPDAEIFAHVCEALQCEPGQILFVDDNPVNVRAGAAAGLQAVLARGLQQVEAALLAAKILS